MPLCNLAQTREALLQSTSPLPVARVPLLEALDRVLAHDVTAPADLPAADCATVEGYAVRAAELAAASENNPLHISITGKHLHPGNPLPTGADAVIPIEQTRPHHGDFVAVLTGVDLGDNIARAGTELRTGEVALPGGTRLGPAQLALAGALGYLELPVHERPRVSLLVVGGETTGELALRGWLVEAGTPLIDLGAADEEAEALAEKFEYGLDAGDVIISLGGNSELIERALTEAGCEAATWQVHMNPGGPLVVGRRGALLVFALPGDYWSAAVTFLVLVRPVLVRLGAIGPLPDVAAVVEADWANPTDRPCFRPGRLERREGRWHVWPVESPGPATRLARADCLVEVPEASTLARGSTVNVQVIHG